MLKMNISSVIMLKFIIILCLYPQTLEFFLLEFLCGNVAMHLLYQVTVQPGLVILQIFTVTVEKVHCSPLSHPPKDGKIGF